MPDTLDDLLMRRPPTAERPLLGTVVLVVEDSRHACESLRMICQRSGARIRRAESLSSAQRHLRAYRPQIAIIDMGLPDGSGASLIADLDHAEPRIEAIVAISGDDTQKDAAMAVGADLFLAKPFASFSEFQASLLSVLPADSKPSRIATQIDDEISPDPIALRDDLSLMAELLRTDADTETCDYAAGFLAGVGKSAKDSKVVSLAAELARGGPKVAIKLSHRIQAHAQTIEID